MSNAYSTVLLLAIPLAIMTVFQFGWLRSTVFYLVAGGLLSLAIAILIIAGMGASAMAAGHGGGGSGGWDGSAPLVLHGIVSVVLLLLGAIARPEATMRSRTEPTAPVKLRTLREAQDTKNQAEQGVAPQSATRSESDKEGGDKPQPESETRPR